MKKVMIGILILIPLVVLLVVGLVTTFVSVNAYIGVESVHLDKHELTIELQTVYKLDGDGGVFEVKVLPEMAFDRSYEWTIENVRSRDADYHDEKNGENGFYYVELIDANGNHVDSMGSGARLRANVHCNFELKVTAATYTDTCSVVVGGDVTAVTLDSEMTLAAAHPSFQTDLTAPESARRGAQHDLRSAGIKDVVRDVRRRGDRVAFHPEAAVVGGDGDIAVSREFLRVIDLLRIPEPEHRVRSYARRRELLCELIERRATYPPAREQRSFARKGEPVAEPGERVEHISRGEGAELFGALPHRLYEQSERTLVRVRDAYRAAQEEPRDGKLHELPRAHHARAREF